MKNSNQHVCKARNIGSIASEILSKDQDALVFGITSKGVYVKTSSRWLVFLSFDPFRGPLTITLDEVSSTLQLLGAGRPVHLTSQSISIPDVDIIISITGSQVWQPADPSPIQLDNPERHQILVRVANEVISNEVFIKKTGVGLGGYLPLILGSPNAHPPPRLVNNIDWGDVQQLGYYLRNREALPLAKLLSDILGAGPGLTPSADDFVIGLLLSLNRWQKPFWSADSLRSLNDQLVKAAYLKTTTLSANLIECATLGWADERLINALDLLVTGIAREPEIVAHLLGWGHSSGVDAFVGMAVSLTA